MKICACGTTDDALATAIRSLELPLKAGDCAVWLSTVISLQMLILMKIIDSDYDSVMKNIKRLDLPTLVILSQNVKDLIEMERELRDAP